MDKLELSRQNCKEIIIPISTEDVQGLLNLVQGLWASVCYRFTDNTVQEVEVRFVREEEVRFVKEEN